MSHRRANGQHCHAAHGVTPGILVGMLHGSAADISSTQGTYQAPGSRRLSRHGPAALVFSIAVLCGACTRGGTPASAAQMVALILDADSSANNVWPGYSLPDRNLLIYDRTGGYLITTQARPASFEVLPDSVPLLQKRERVYWRKGGFTGLGDGAWNLQYAIDGLVVAAFPATTVENIDFFYHETFHTYQGERFLFRGDDTSSAPQVFTKEYAAAVEVERRILHKALASGDAVQDSLVRQFLAIRLLRQRAAGSGLTIVEQNAEKREGLADFVGYASTVRALDKPEQWRSDRIRKMLKAPLKSGFSLGQGGPAERLIRMRSYGTGAAMAILLEQRGMEWKQQVQQGAALDELLVTAVAFDTSAAAEIARQGREAFGYDKLFALKNPPWGSLQGMEEADFAVLGKYRLLIEVGDSVSSTFEPGSLGIHNAAEGVVLIPDLEHLRIYDPKYFTVEVEDRPAKFDSRTERLVTIMLDGPPQLDGVAVVAGSKVEISAGRIHVKGVTIIVNGPVTIATDSTSMRIAPRGAGG